LESLQGAASPNLQTDNKAPVNLKANNPTQIDAKQIKLPKMRDYRKERLERMEKRLEERKQMTQFILRLIMGGVAGGFSRVMGSSTGSGLGTPGVGGSSLGGTGFGSTGNTGF
jgi:hypothetical protein